ncbi:Cation efflux family [Novymonas esmeraldas]|uniref:Cation efflux family n=1 Tax=Novymonas esmeraldas TaxID=1808958 RepID=A0AAW0F7Z5_9TRYP
MANQYGRVGSHVICGYQRLQTLIAEEEEHGRAPSSTRALWAAVVFATVMMLVEAVGGVMSGSLAVLCDAVHMLADVFTLLISLFAAYASRWHANDCYTFAWRRAEVLGAMASVFTTWGLVVWITVSAVQRVPEVLLCAMDAQRASCEVLQTPLMMGLGCFGFAMNVLLTGILYCGGVHAHSHGSLFDAHDHEHSHEHGHSHGDAGHHHEHSHSHSHAHSHEHSHEHDRDTHVQLLSTSDDMPVAATSTRGSLSVRVSRESHADAPAQGAMNQRAALLHVFGDCLQALGVVVAAGVMWAGNSWTQHTASTAHSYFNLADPILSLVFGVITVGTTRHLVMETWQILMERVPPTLAYQDFADVLLREDVVDEVLDLHLWMVGPNLSVLCATLGTSHDLLAVDAQRLIERLTDRCVKMGAQHCTFQLEYTRHARTDDDAPVETALAAVVEMTTM